MIDPKVGLYASFCIAVLTAIFGGRPGMISAATAATALLMVTLVKEHGLQYLLAATVLTGVLQVIAGALKVGTIMRFVSRSVMTGFVNALAILIFMAQLPEFKGAGVTVYVMVAAALAIIYLLPRVTKAVPSPLVAIIVLTIISMIWKLDVRTVGDLGELPSTLPLFLWPQVPLTLATLWIVLPYSLGIAAVGLLESLMTAQIVDEMTDTPSDKNRECTGQGIANFVSGFFGGMAGCAMIGQSVINVKSGGRGRLSSFAAGVFLLVLLVALNPWAKQIPMPALVAVMIMVSIGTFSWASFKNLRVHPKSTSLVMIATVVTVVWTHNLALGVGVGVLLSALFALDAATGQVRWKLPRAENHSNFATPCIYQPTGGPAQVIVSSWRLGITGVELATGRQLWQKTVFGQKQERAIASPFVSGDLVFANCGFAGRDKHVVVLRPGATAGTMDEAWRVEKGAPHIPSPVVVGDRAFLWNDQGVITCVKLA